MVISNIFLSKKGIACSSSVLIGKNEEVTFSILGYSTIAIEVLRDSSRFISFILLI